MVFNATRSSAGVDYPTRRIFTHLARSPPYRIYLPQLQPVIPILQLVIERLGYTV
jgi:hypothetical protein